MPACAQKAPLAHAMTRSFSQNNRPHAGSLSASDEQRPPPARARPSRAAGLRPEPASSLRMTSRDTKATAATVAFGSGETSKTKLTGDTSDRQDGNFYAFRRDRQKTKTGEFARSLSLPLPQPPRDFLRRRERPHARGPTEGPAPPAAHAELLAALNEKDPAATRSSSNTESPTTEDLSPIHRKAALRRSGQPVWLHFSHASDGTFLPALAGSPLHGFIQLSPPALAVAARGHRLSRTLAHLRPRRLLMPP